MNAKNAKKPPEIVSSITITLLRNSDGVLYCDTDPALDESKLTAHEVAKMQFHLLHRHAALVQMAGRMLELELEKMHNQLKKVHPKAVPATNQRDIT
jgi:hypothetical protein